MPLLAIETSCDETSVAVVGNGRVFSSVVSSQITLHAEYGGVVPELAAREHLRNLLPVAKAALTEAGVRPGQLDAVAATRGPGLPNALLVGFKAAQAMAFVLRKPFFGVHHHEAHLYSPWITDNPLTAEFDAFEPNVALIVSGGHTLLVHVESELKHRVLGSTIDDAAGECFDKAGKLMGLPYPAGPEIDRLAGQGNRAAYDFPRPLLRDSSDDFSFSGLK
ncbi:MAG TPA: tRNA (adenosine(37)-N6)-threonylcarbamoyltransferase complex transferase subunit TsaD, partial [Verrucomicrobiae bacterium]|nr:tRNA (adenosine(37)-N6)-threonylcarbamoyltransferase complex transferase subunit TsaD [Verrucomicrobiae bacterium]